MEPRVQPTERKNQKPEHAHTDGDHCALEIKLKFSFGLAAVAAKMVVINDSHFR